MLCNDVQDSLKVYIDGAMGPEQRRAVEAHLQSCANCRAALERIDRLAVVLLDAKPPPVPPGFASRVMLAAKSRKRATNVAAGNPWQWWKGISMPMRAAAAAVLIVGVSVGLLMSWAAGPPIAALADRKVTAAADPLDAYNLDYLSDTPEGSIAEGYLALVWGGNEGGR